MLYDLFAGREAKLTELGVGYNIILKEQLLVLRVFLHKFLELWLVKECHVSIKAQETSKRCLRVISDSD